LILASRDRKWHVHTWRIARHLSYAALGTTGTTLYDNYADPRYPDASPKPTDQMPPLNAEYAQRMLDLELYR
jgi:hypothetical protein